MKVIGAGFGRTGTFSLRSALETLGFGPCYHMTELGSHPEHAPIWAAAARGNSPDWPEFLVDYQSTTDWPGCLFWKELSEAFPEAKVLLNTRDPERWYESVQHTFLEVAGDQPPEEAESGSAPAGTAAMFDMMQAVMGRQFGSFDNIGDKDTALQAFADHYQAVRDTIPGDRLLEYEVKDGWESLCAFLDVPIPEEPFPHLNDRANFRELVEEHLGAPPPEQQSTAGQAANTMGEPR